MDAGTSATPSTEGATSILVPATNLAKPLGAPGAREAGQPFFNPGMALNRDLSVLLVEAYARAKGREIDVADALCGTGARSLRLANEVGSRVLVHANDAQPEAVAAARAGAQANPATAGRLEIHAGDAHAFLASRRFDVVDVDPCGSPMPFLDAAVRATRHGGLVCVTATDTGALAGTYPRACRRRYDAHHGLHAMPWRSEVGLRVLAGAIVRAAARFDRAATPVLSVSRGHWMRVVARLEDGKRLADDALRRLGYAAADADTGGGRWLAGQPAAVPGAWAGPLWSGPLHDATLVQGMQAAAAGRVLADNAAVAALLPVLADECAAPAFWIMPEWVQQRGGKVLGRDESMRRMRAAGLAAHRTHLEPAGVRADADLQTLAQAWATEPA